MSEKFQDIYRIPSARAAWWDYRNDAAYFVTICTAGREHYFGEIRDEIMYLSEMGKFAHENWHEMPDHCPFVKLDSFVVMPNHLHGILVIDNLVDFDCRDDVGRDAINRVSTCEQSEPPEKIGGITGENNPMLFDNLSRAIRWYKGKTTFKCHSLHADFGWQTRFHDHIIRDEESWKNIQEYILNNPARWDKDKYIQPE